ncbi:tyrosine-type recombinase/integrase [Streptomyces sp. B1866]|uniref:tyrosine-type recombinase/integrase n=1 Tax=Streptomyces sp. B1866 TaxID=3075431 RepID=UPI00288FE028|nr:tyrosine-type recombinase/integrase [Streptomyces sp. B1866]MDT3397724.1 tyrosine-type recombinase/integrase [Streptomyces sp. B1866]
MKGSTYRRCYCRDADGKPYGKSCPKLAGTRRHGTYSIRQELPARPDGSRRSFNRAGYPTLKEAQADLDHVRALLGLAEADDPEGQESIAALLEKVADEKSPLPDVEETRRRLHTGQDLTVRITVGEWLDTWLAGKKGRPSSISREASIIRVHLKPRLGHLRLDRLRTSHLTEAFEAIAEASVQTAENNAARRAAVAELGTIPWKGRDNRARRKALKEHIAQMAPYGRIVGASTRQRIRSSLRAALNVAIKRQLITFNPAAHIELDAGRRPKALVWTDERVEHWQRTGERPSPVMVWTPEQTGAFLDHAETDPLYALFHLIAFRGLRRGEGCGQQWTDTDLKAKRITVAKQLVVDGWEVYEDDPKTSAGVRTIALDDGTVDVLRAHRERQDRAREEWGDAWVETGRVFTQDNGAWLHPATVTRRFLELSEEAGLPPIRLHDLRHGAATLAHAAGADLKAIQEMLGHSSITITADTYTSLLPEVDRTIAEAAARLVPRARKPYGTGQPPAEDPGGAAESREEPAGGLPSAHAPLTQTAPDEESEAA